ncbi:hemicentin-1-like [Conger conger]|uniref:hemicentin-1-like n=1 Tax=Conger conger TaxID=82655 RepID=UPI002A59DC8B|nr:hemicentin-1-like [Conger conger]
MSDSNQKAGCSSGLNYLPLGPLNGEVGGSVTFTTTVNPTGPELAAITWSFNKGSGPVSVIAFLPTATKPGPGYVGRVSLNNVTGFLELRELTLGDSGDYSVTLTTSNAQSLQGKTRLEVYEKISGVKTTVPTGVLITDGPEDVFIQGHREIEVGNRVVLTCSASSISPATFTWTFNGKETGVLTEEYTIANATIDHEKISGVKTTVPTGVLIAEKISDVNITGPTGVLIAGNGSANLSCQAAAGTLISRKWLKDGNSLSPSNRITVSGDNSSVSIDPVQGSDNGHYQCRLTNPVSTDTVSYYLTVNYGPEDVVIQRHREIEVGNTVVLICSASSVPPATFTWTFNGTETGVLTEEYTIANALIDYSGTYTCLARNSVTGLNISSAPHLLTVTVPAPLGAILGGTFGALACVALAGGAFVCMKKKKRRDIPCNQDAQAVVYENTKELGGPVVYENLAEGSIDPRSVASENRDDYQELQFKDSATYCTMKSH